MIDMKFLGIVLIAIFLFFGIVISAILMFIEVIHEYKEEGKSIKNINDYGKEK